MSDVVPKPLSRAYFLVPAIASLGQLGWLVNTGAPLPIVLGFAVLAGWPTVGLALLVGKSEGIAWAHKAAIDAALSSSPDGQKR